MLLADIDGDLGVYDAEDLSIGSNMMSVYVESGSGAMLKLLPRNGNLNDVEVIQEVDEQTCYNVSDLNAGNIMKLKLEVF